jgi:hypothetical protein
MERHRGNANSCSFNAGRYCLDPFIAGTDNRLSEEHGQGPRP